MDLRQLRYFIALAEERHFTRAAERLGIAQSALSQQIKALERSLSVSLVDRRPRPIRLTEAGEDLLQDARLMVELADRAAERARLRDRRTKTVLKLGGSVAGIGPVAEDVLREFGARRPDVLVELYPDVTKQNIQGLNRRALDAVFAYLPFESPVPPRYLRLDAFELLLTLREDHRLASFERVPREGLLEEPFLVWPRNLNPPFVDHVHRLIFGRADHPRAIEIPDMVSRLRLAKQGIGIGPIAFPEEALLPTAELVYRPFEDPAPIIETAILWLDDHISSALPALLDVARGVVGQRHGVDSA